MKKEFIKIGETRIKRSNIKTFGISSDDYNPNRKPDSLPLASGISSFFKHGSFSDGGMFGELELQESRRYLFITTYQGDNYKFYASDFDIKTPLNDLGGED
jgi:hypothetical protein